MANEEQLSILRQGVEVWNKWIKDSNIGIDLTGANLEDVDLTKANFRQGRLSGASFKGARLDGATFFFADLTSANFSNASLHSTFLSMANLTSAQLSHANLYAANFRHAYLNDANLDEADLSLADLTNVELNNTNFYRVILNEAAFNLNDLSQAIKLDEVLHYGPSYISIQTLQKSKGLIPEVFLRGCGLSDLDIEYSKLANPDLNSEQVTDITYKIHRLYLSGGIQYYSCFISYSSQDNEFAQKLHDDLQNNGVRCWFDVEDIRIGDPIRPTIDRQIRLRDKLLVILSENSIKSEYVGDEVEAALEEEQKSNKLSVFPIRLDDTVLNTRDDWAAKIKRRRHIGDFSNWKDKVSYQKAFERLLRDLKATGGQVNGE